VITLALGIGATTAVYSIASTILLTPLPYPESDRLVRLTERLPPTVGGPPPRRRGITHNEFLEWRTRTTTLSTMVATLWDPQVMVSTPQGAARLSGGLVSP
jgi:putative ABC transport system permease protein